MIKRELLSNLKSFIIFISVLILMFLFVYALYPFIINEESMKSMNELMNSLPEDMRKAFNMDLSSLETAYGWVKTEGLTFIYLTIGIYASILGANILLKEEANKTVEYLAYLPIKRSKVLTNKLIVSLIYIVSMVLLFTVINYVALLLSCSFDTKEFFLLFLSSLLIALPLFSLNLLISTLLKKNKKMLGISLGIAFISYVLNMVSEISKDAEKIKYITIFSLSDTRGIIQNGSISIVCVAISLALTFIFTYTSYIVYNKKELI